MRLFFAILFLVALTTSGCFRSYEQGARVIDVTRGEVLTLKKLPSEGPIQAISIDGFGTIAGSAEVQLILNGAVYQRSEISGRFTFHFGGDWYSDTAEIRYIPKSVSSGNVSLHYEFRGVR